jgi:hypothetical protein
MLDIECFSFLNRALVCVLLLWYNLLLALGWGSICYNKVRNCGNLKKAKF